MRAAAVLMGLTVSAASCAGAAGERARATSPCDRSAVVRDAGELAQIAPCTAVAGDLVVRGGALEAAPPLSELRSIAGSAHIGPTLALASVDLLNGLVTVEGSLVIDSNLAADGVYLPALRRVGGDFIVTNNVAATGVNAPALEEVGGDVRVAGNPSLARIDVSRLSRVAGRFEVSRNAVLEDLAAPRLADVGRQLMVEDNPALPAAVASELRARVGSTRSRPTRPAGGSPAPSPEDAANPADPKTVDQTLVRQVHRDSQAIGGQHR